MSFTVICVDTGVHWPAGESPRIFATGAEAAAMAGELTANCAPLKYQPRPFDGPDPDLWKARERARFESGHYTPLAFANADWYLDATAPGRPCADHFAHVARRDPTKLAYVESPEKGRRDITTSMRVGAYLQEYFAGVLTQGERERVAREHLLAFGPPPEIRFADTPAHILAVYYQGPRSCMGGHNPDYPWTWRNNPTRVYGAGDLAVAYVLASRSPEFDPENPESEEFRPSARVLCWPAKKRYGRTYGDESSESRLISALEAEGYSESFDFDGARILKERFPVQRGGDSICYFMPYIDGDSVRVRDCGDHYKIDGDGDHGAMTTAGYVRSYEARGTCCAGCNVRFDDSDLVTEEGVQWCTECYDNTFDSCPCCGVATRCEDMTTVQNEAMCAACYDRDTADCVDCEARVIVDLEACDDSRCDRCARLHIEALEYEARGLRAPSPTVNSANQESFILVPPFVLPRAPRSADSWSIVGTTLATGAIFTVTFDCVTGRTTGTRAEADARVAHLMRSHYATTRYEIRSLEQTSLIIGGPTRTGIAA